MVAHVRKQRLHISVPQMASDRESWYIVSDNKYWHSSRGYMVQLSYGDGCEVYSNTSRLTEMQVK